MKRHNFIRGNVPVMEDVPAQWHRVEAKCTRCGEQRKVYWAVPQRQLDASGFCTGTWLTALIRRWSR